MNTTPAPWACLFPVHPPLAIPAQTRSVFLWDDARVHARVARLGCPGGDHRRRHGLSAPPLGGDGQDLRCRAGGLLAAGAPGAGVHLIAVHHAVRRALGSLAHHPSCRAGDLAEPADPFLCRGGHPQGGYPAVSWVLNTLAQHPPDGPWLLVARVIPDLPST
jgi:hypothetical protein